MTTNEQPIDRFTPLHFIGGFVLGKWDVSMWKMVVIAITWEMFEKYVKTQKPEFFPDSSPDTKINSTMDVVATIGGYLAVDYLTTSGHSRKSG